MTLGSSVQLATNFVSIVLFSLVFFRFIQLGIKLDIKFRLFKLQDPICIRFGFPLGLEIMFTNFDADHHSTGSNGPISYSIGYLMDIDGNPIECQSNSSDQCELASTFNNAEQI